MTNHRQTERSKDDGPHPEGGKAGSPFRDHLAATLAHELRDPLASILTSLEVLRRNGVDPSVARQAHERAERQARHMARIVEDMLDIFRSGHGTLRLRKERVVLTALMVDAIETARPLITSRGHHLTVSLPPQPVSLLGDPSRLHQVITNLLTNAARYTAPGGEIGLAAEVADGVVVLRVRDDGMGIAPELLPRVFDLSQRGDRPGDRAFGDLGIGLVVVKALVELHGGSIAAYSQGPSTGSEFVVRLPGCAPSREEGRAPGGLARVISAGLVIGPWLRPTGGRWWQVLLAAAALALTALLQFVWLDRARSTRRWKAALDAYAEREIARDRRKPRDVEAPARPGGVHVER